MELKETIEHAISLLDIETRSAIPLLGEELKRLTQWGAWGPTAPIYYTGTNLIFLAQEDFVHVSSKLKKPLEIIALDMKEFFTQVYVLNYSNSPELLALLDWK